MEVLGWIEDVAREMRVWCVKMVENAVGDDEGIKEMSQQLGCRPCICARVAKKGAPQPARAEGNPEELGVTSPFSCFPLMPFPSPVTFADLSGCFVKRSSSSSRRFEKDAQEGNEEKRVRERLSVQQGSRGPAERYTVALQELVLVYRIMLWKWRWSR